MGIPDGWRQSLTVCFLVVRGHKQSQHAQSRSNANARTSVTEKQSIEAGQPTEPPAVLVPSDGAGLGTKRSGSEFGKGHARGTEKRARGSGH